MTETTTSVSSIHVTLYSHDIPNATAAEGEAICERMVEIIEAECSARWPGAEVEIMVIPNTSGAKPRDEVRDETGMDMYDESVELREIVGSAWERACEEVGADHDPDCERVATRAHRRLTGESAIAHAERRGGVLNKYADPTEDARSGLTPDEAREIARVDPSLIWVDI